MAVKKRWYRYTHFGYRLVIYSHAVIDQHRSLITQLIRQIYIFVIAWYNIFLFLFEVDRKSCRYYLMELCLIVTDIWETIPLQRMLYFVLRITINFFFYLKHTYPILFYFLLHSETTCHGKNSSTITRKYHKFPVSTIVLHVIYKR